MAKMPAPRTSSLLGSRWWLNLALAALVIALAALLFHTRSRQSETGDGQLMLVAPSEDIARIRVERPNAPDIVLEKRGERFWLRAPVEARINDFNLRQLLRIARLKSERKLAAAPADYSRYGLDRPQARIWFDDAALAIGALHPLHGQYYVLYRDTVHLVASHSLSAAFYDYTQFLDTRLLEEGLKLTALEFPDFRLTLEKGTWQRQPPIKTLSSDRINDFIAEWHNARALRVERHEGSRRPREWITLSVMMALEESNGTKQPSREQQGASSITGVRQHDGRTKRLRIGILERVPEVVLLRADERLEYHFPQEMGKRLLNLGNP